MGDLLLGIDVGTYSTKGVLVRPDGSVLKTHTIDHGMDIPRPGWAEQDADLIWWKDVVGVCRALLDGSPYRPRDVGGVALSAIGPCLVALDEKGQPVRPGILYGVDTRATSEIAYLTERIGSEIVFAFSGMEFSSQAVGPKILWMMRNEPELWARVSHVTSASSYLVYRLTGEKVMDRHTASHFMPLIDIGTLEWSERYSSEMLDIRILPRLAWCDEVAGEVGERGAQETGLVAGTPVAVGGVDALTEAISVGVVNPGDLMIMYGSTTFFILVLAEPVPDRRLWTVAGAFRGQYNLAAGMATTGSLTRWFRDQLAAELRPQTAYATLFAEAATVNPGANGLLVLPYFSGERTPINDPLARGVIAGLSLSHTRKDLYRAILEGVAYGIRHNLETFQSIGAPPKRIVAVGGGTQSLDWLQIVSDVAGVSQAVPATTIGASYGDAFLAGLASGLLNRGDIKGWTSIARELHPREDVHRLYDDYYADYLGLYQATRGIVHRLSTRSQ